MLNLSSTYLDSFTSPSRKVKGYVAYTVNNVNYKMAAETNLINFKIERTMPSGKLFGFAVSQQLSIEALGAVEIPKGTKLTPVISIETETALSKLPAFYVDSVEIDKVNKKTTIIAYDNLKRSNKTIDELNIVYPVTTVEFAKLLGNEIGAVSVNFHGAVYDIEAANFEGFENLHSILNALAEATGTICYMRADNILMFDSPKALTGSQATLTPDHYFEFSINEEEDIVTRIVSATELGDNVGYGTPTGRTITLWENPFLVLQHSAAVQAILADIGENLIGFNIRGYNLSWRGCPAFEIGDRITIVDKEGKEYLIQYLDETLTYDGGLRSVSSWQLGEEENENGSAHSVGKILSNTYAKVDKANKRVELMVQETQELQDNMSTLLLDTEGIRADVQKVTIRNDEAIDSLTENISTLTEKVSASMTESQVSILVQKEINSGIAGSITTTTGFTFDEVGLTVSKTGSEMTTLIDEDGMTVFRDNQEVLIADSQGVDATNLKASTFLIIGDRSRFENYNGPDGQPRTGCFWLG